MTPIFDRYGNLIAIEGIARDISQHVRAREPAQRRAASPTRRRGAPAPASFTTRSGRRSPSPRCGCACSERLPGDATDAADKLKLLDDLIKETLQNVRTLSRAAPAAA